MKNYRKIIISIFALVLSFQILTMGVLAANNSEAFTQTSEDEEYYGYEEDSYEWITSVPEEEENSINSNDSYQISTRDLPSSVDLSQSIYFPPIGNQGSVGSCCSFATTYYQYTYEANKLDGVATNSDMSNVYCPQWPYSLQCLGNYERGTTFEGNYEVLKALGGLKYSDYNLSNINTPTKFATYWHNGSAEKKAALNKTCSYYKATADCTKHKPDNTIGEDLTPIQFDGGIDTNQKLISIKNKLNQGYVLTAPVRFRNRVTRTATNGEKIIIYTKNSQTGHAVTIVGYDDNIMVDANNDGSYEDWEHGAFKIANSWGTARTDHNNGYIWVLYDALNCISYCSDITYNPIDRAPFIDVFHNSNSYEIVTYYLSVANRTNYMIGEVFLSLQNKYKLSISYGVKQNSTYIYSDAYPALLVSGDSVPNGTVLTPYYGSLVFPLTPSTNYGNYYDDNDCFINLIPLTDFSYSLSSYKVYDDKNLLINESLLPVSLNTLQNNYTYVDTSTQIGDLNYDWVFDNTDVNYMKSFLASATVPSNIQRFLADINGDGYLSVMDLVLLKHLVNGDDLSTLDEEDLLLEIQSIYY